MAANPFAALIEAARINERIAAEYFPAVTNGLPLAPWSGAFDETPFPTDADGHTLYDSVEFAGEAGLYAALATMANVDVLWTGAIAWQGHGIDAIARDRRTDRHLICEAKGTQNPIAASPLPYLRETRHKGRQLSWRWCWASLIDMADHPTTAAVFLHLLAPMLTGRCERLLAVSRVVRRGGGHRILESRIRRETELAAHAPLAQRYDLRRQRRMWAALPHDTRAGFATA